MLIIIELWMVALRRRVLAFCKTIRGYDRLIFIRARNDGRAYLSMIPHGEVLGVVLKNWRGK